MVLTYSMYGLRVESDFPLPLPTEALEQARPPVDCVFEKAGTIESAPPADGPVVAGLPCHAPCHGGRLVTAVSRGSGRTWFWSESVGTCVVAENARRVSVYTQADYDDRALALALTGQVATFVLHKLGYPSLHASAVVTDEGVLAFLGHPGHGKSTMAALFLSEGGTLLTDDVLPLSVLPDGIHGVPSLPLMKLWEATAQHTLELKHALPNITRQYAKKLLTLDRLFAFATTSAPITAIYVLERYEPLPHSEAPVSIERLGQRAGLQALLTHTSNRAFLSPAENAALLPLYAQLLQQVVVRRLRFPNGFEHQSRVRDRMLEELARP